MTVPVEQLSDAEITLRDAAYWLPYAAFWNVGFSAEDDSIEFAIGPDPLGTVPAGYPYPTSGLNLGKIEGKLAVRKGATRTDDPPEEMAVASRSATFSGYKRAYEFTLASSGRKVIIDLFDDPGDRSSVHSAGGADINCTYGTLLLLFADELKPRFMAIMNWKASPNPADEEYGSDDVHEIKAVFNCYIGDDPRDLGCPRDGSNAVWKRFFLNEDLQLINPDTMEPIDPETPPDDYPALGMAGML